MAKENKMERELLSRMISSYLRRFRKDRPFTLPHHLTGSKRILVVDSGETVDLLFAAPVVNWFHENHPEVKITLLVLQKDAEVAKSIMKVSGIITCDPKQLRLFKADYMALSRKLKKLEIDTVILTSRQMSLERHLLAFMTGAAARIGFAFPIAFPFVNCEVKISEEAYIGSGMPRILQSLGLGAGGFQGRTAIAQQDVQHARQLIHFRKPEKGVLTVGIDPGNGKTSHTVIPEIIAYLANNLAGRLRVKFLLLMNPWDQRLIERLKGELKGETIDLEPSNQAETLALLSNCDLFLSGNTDLFHFAAEFDVPVIGLFTKYDGRHWIPENRPNVRIFKGVKGEQLSLKTFFTDVEELLQMARNRQA